MISRKCHLCLCFLLCGCLFASCTTTREQENDTVYQDYVNWIDNQADKVQTVSEEEWAEVRNEYERKTRQLELRKGKVNNGAKAQYEEAKSRFMEWDEQNRIYAERRIQLELLMAEQQELTKWEQELLGEFADSEKLTATTMRQAYALFVERVRVKCRSWNEKEWQLARQVLSKLNYRKQELKQYVPQKDHQRIQALQTEFQALEARGLQQQE